MLGNDIDTHSAEVIPEGSVTIVTCVAPPLALKVIDKAKLRLSLRDNNRGIIIITLFEVKRVTPRRQKGLRR